MNGFWDYSFTLRPITFLATFVNGGGALGEFSIILQPIIDFMVHNVEFIRNTNPTKQQYYNSKNILVHEDEKFRWFVNFI